MPDFGRWTSNGGDPSLNEINRSDRFLDALAANQPPYSTDGTEAELAFLLADWRDGVRDPAVTTPVTARDAVAALQNGLATKRNRGSLTIVGSVAAALLCLGGFGTAVYGAEPGDPLYGVRTTLFGAPRVSDEQVMLAAQTEMQQVQTLIDQGQWQQAQDKLQQLSPTVQSVDTPEHKQQLIQQWNALTYKVVEQNPAATLPPPGEPMPVLPSSPLTLLPVPVVSSPSQTTSTTTATTTTSTTTTSATTSESTATTSSTTTPSSATETSSSTATTSSTTTPSSATETTAAPTGASASTPTTTPTTAASTPEPSAPTKSAASTSAATSAPASPAAPTETSTTVATTVQVPAATPTPATKEAHPEPSPERSAVTTTSAADGPAQSGRGQH